MPTDSRSNFEVCGSGVQVTGSVFQVAPSLPQKQVTHYIFGFMCILGVVEIARDSSCRARNKGCQGRRIAKKNVGLLRPTSPPPLPVGLLFLKRQKEWATPQEASFEACSVSDVRGLGDFWKLLLSGGFIRLRTRGSALSLCIEVQFSD